jgi:hypothetical protein
MKAHVLYDTQGKIISAGFPLPLTFDILSPRFGPKPSEGQYAAILDVPEELGTMDLVELAQRLQVDTKGKPHKLILTSK